MPNEATFVVHSDPEILGGVPVFVGTRVPVQSLSLGPAHGYGILLRIQQISRDRLQIQQGSLYPALYRLEHQGIIASTWGTSDNNRRAKFYRLTTAGRRRLQQETDYWRRLSEAIGLVLGTQPGDV